MKSKRVLFTALSTAALLYFCGVTLWSSGTFQTYQDETPGKCASGSKTLHFLQSEECRNASNNKTFGEISSLTESTYTQRNEFEPFNTANLVIIPVLIGLYSVGMYLLWRGNLPDEKPTYASLRTSVTQRAGISVPTVKGDAVAGIIVLFLAALMIGFFVWIKINTLSAT